MTILSLLVKSKRIESLVIPDNGKYQLLFLRIIDEPIEICAVLDCLIVHFDDDITWFDPMIEAGLLAMTSVTKTPSFAPLDNLSF